MKRVLFVCIENSCRSQIAEAFGRMYGEGGVEFYSSGSKPSGTVNQRAIESMRELGYDLSTHSSKSLGEIPDVEYDIVVTMGCGDECPVVRAKERVEWNIPDPKDLPEEEFRKVRDMIGERVRDIISRLK